VSIPAPARTPAASDGRLSRAEAQAILQSRLGREPQDVIEAAVVLEAWGGLPAEHALAAAQECFGSIHAVAEPAAEPPEPEEEAPRAPSDALTMLLALATILLWTSPLRSQLGESAFTAAVRLSVPLILGAQWLVATRYLFDRWWLERLRHDRRLLAALAGASLAAGAAAGRVGLLAVELCVLWAAAAIVVRRGRRLTLVALLAATTAALFAGEPALAVLAALDVALIAAVGLLLRGAASGLYRGRPWPVAGRACALGAGLGLLLISERMASFGGEPRALALALIPPTLASFWGGWHLASLWRVVRDSLDGQPLAAASAAAWRSPALRVAAGAAWRTGLTLGVLTPICAAAGTAAGLHVAAAPALAGLAAFAFASVGAGLLHAIERTSTAIAAVASGCVTAVTVELLGVHDGTALLAGSLLATAVMAAVAAGALRRPAHLFATIVR
jgi:hypothetical protein